MKEADDLYFETYNEVKAELYFDALAYRKGKKLHWQKIQPLQLKLTWESYMRMGIVLNTKIIDRLQDIMLRNTCMLDILTACMGHSQWCGVKELISEYEPTPYQRRKLYRVFHEEDWACFSNNQPLLSDYAIKPLNNLLFELLNTTSYEKKLVLIDRMLNVIHMRSDLCELYVVGGSKTLSELSGTPEKVINHN